MFNALLRSVQKLRRGRSHETAKLVLTPDGFEVRHDDGRTHVFRWAWAERIIAYKVDLLTTDEIFVAFEYHDTEGRQMTFNVSEESAGFPEFMAALGRAFPGMNPDWYAQVMKPAFARNLTVLYPFDGADRSSGPAQREEDHS